MHWKLSVKTGTFLQDLFFPSLAQLPNCDCAKCQMWPLTGWLQLTWLRLTPKKGAELLISADLGAAAPQEPLAVVDEQGVGARAGQLWVGGHGPRATGSAAGAGFDAQGTPGEPHCRAIWPQFGDAHGYF